MSMIYLYVKFQTPSTNDSLAISIRFVLVLLRTQTGKRKRSNFSCYQKCLMNRRSRRQAVGGQAARNNTNESEEKRLWLILRYYAIVGLELYLGSAYKSPPACVSRQEQLFLLPLLLAVPF
jgi:hypothetical protein